MDIGDAGGIRLDPCPLCGLTADAVEVFQRTDDPAMDHWYLSCARCQYVLTDEEQRAVILRALAEVRHGHPG